MNDMTSPQPQSQPQSQPQPQPQQTDAMRQREAQRVQISAELAKAATEVELVRVQVAARVPAAQAPLARFKETYVGLCALRQRELLTEARAASIGKSIALGPLPQITRARALIAVFTILLMVSIFSFKWAVFLAAIVYGFFFVQARKAYMRTSEVEIAGIDQLKAFPLAIMQFGPEPSDDPHYPYHNTQVVLDDRGVFFNGWTVDKSFGDLCGATFVGFMSAPGEHECSIFFRLQTPNGKPEIIDYRGTEAAKFAPVTAAMLPLLRAMGDEIVSATLPLTALAESDRMRRKKYDLLQARLHSFDAQEKNWKKVAVNSVALDQILLQIELFKHGGSGAPRGILLYGPPGTGKTTIARNLAATSGLHFMAVNSADLKGEAQGQTAPKVVAMFAAAREKAPCIMFIDECEGILGSRQDAGVNFNNELVETFLAQWDGMNTVAGQVFVVGATNRREGLDTAVVSRFNQLIEIGLPDVDLRKRILATELQKCSIDLPVSDRMAKETAGMAGRDLQNLVVRFQGAVYTGTQDEATFCNIIKEVRGKASTSTEDVTWDQVILPEPVKLRLKALAKKIQRADEYQLRGLPVPKNMILYGPPGTGKTQIARALASESGIAFLAVTTADLQAQYVGQSGARVKALFEKARTQSPCLVFIDEIDIITGSRSSSNSFSQEIIGQMLQEMDGIMSRTGTGRVFILAATNNLDDIDPAILSRFTEKEEIALPTVEARGAILKVLLAGKPLDFDLASALPALAAATEGSSGRDLASLVNKAANSAMERADAGGFDIDDVKILECDLTGAAMR